MATMAVDEPQVVRFEILREDKTYEILGEVLTFDTDPVDMVDESYFSWTPDYTLFLRVHVYSSEYFDLSLFIDSYVCFMAWVR